MCRTSFKPRMAADAANAPPNRCSVGTLVVVCSAGRHQHKLHAHGHLFADRERHGPTGMQTVVGASWHNTQKAPLLEPWA